MSQMCCLYLIAIVQWIDNGETGAKGRVDFLDPWLLSFSGTGGGAERWGRSGIAEPPVAVGLGKWKPLPRAFGKWG